MKKLLIVSMTMMLSTGLLAQESVVGVWKTIDDETGEAKSHVRVYQKEGKLYGEIVKLLRVEQDTPCTACKGKLKGKPLKGLQVIWDLEKEGERWKGGKILDPESGNIYGSVIWLADNDPDQLRVRGVHWTGFYRTQTWERVN